jgi:hypothetical protein
VGVSVQPAAGLKFIDENGGGSAFGSGTRQNKTQMIRALKMIRTRRHPITSMVVAIEER